MTTSLLLELGNFVNEHREEVYIGDEVLRPTVQTCKADFEKLQVMTREATENGLWIREGTLGGNLVTAEVDPWFLFSVALGGREEGTKFWGRLDSTRYSIVVLQDTIKYKIFKEMKAQ